MGKKNKEKGMSFVEEQLFMQFAPKMIPRIKEMSGVLRKYLVSVPLLEDETHVTICFDFDENTPIGEELWVVSAFKNDTFSREIGSYSIDDFTDLLKLIV